MLAYESLAGVCCFPCPYLSSGDIEEPFGGDWAFILCQHSAAHREDEDGESNKGSRSIAHIIHSISSVTTLARFIPV